MNRRAFLQTGLSATAGLLVGFKLPAQVTNAQAPNAGVTNVAQTKLNAYIHIGTDESVTLMIDKAEMGQGTVTSLSQLLVEELELDWAKFRTEFPPVAREFGFMQGVFGSQSIRVSYVPLRRAGATAREMLIQAAANRWKVDASQCRAEKGAVINTATSARLTYGNLVTDAARLTPPKNVTLKDAKQFKIIGKSPRRLDTPEKVNGRAKFGIDAQVPGMVYAAVARCPVFGGKAASFDDSKAKTLPGYRRTVPISSGVAVVSDNTWSAIQGARALTVKWDEGPNANLTSAAVSKLFAERTLQPGSEARKNGDVASGLSSAAKKVEAVYEVPFLAHATMEPLNATAHVTGTSCDVWASTQGQTSAQAAAMRITGLKAPQVHIHSMFMGGGFGRRSTDDFISEAVELSKAVGAPVKVTWSREDDMRHDIYRPAALARLSAGLDADGWPTAFKATLASPSIMYRMSNGQAPANGMDRTSTEGIHDIEYEIPNILVDYHWTEVGIPVFFWRAVGYTQNTFFMESFVDELAAQSGKDPVEFRRRLLAKSPRLLG
ncbi:MAG TPA: molybdopterin cofactor-binding domain-containing protein, partial [Bryobacteraceae bacterium]|nr:molybdopterin cofactor-binding domain-containing protein [Bryobacteraceae bacterium]